MRFFRFLDRMYGDSVEFTDTPTAVPVGRLWDTPGPLDDDPTIERRTQVFPDNGMRRRSVDRTLAP